MNYEDLTNALSLFFPDLKQHVECEMDTFDCYIPSPHILYGKVFNPFVKELLLRDSDSKAIQQVFGFLEDLAQSEDEEVINLLHVIILEALWDEKDTYEKACKYMLPMTKQIYGLIGEYMKIPTA